MVEEPKDVVAIERTGEFRGRYHVLGGAINPLEGIGPDNLRIRELMTRLGARRGQGADPRHRPEHRGRGDRDLPGAAGQADGDRGDPAGQRPAGRRRPGVRRRDHPRPRLRGPPRRLTRRAARAAGSRAAPRVGDRRAVDTPPRLPSSGRPGRAGRSAEPPAGGCPGRRPGPTGLMPAGRLGLRPADRARACPWATHGADRPARRPDTGPTPPGPAGPMPAGRLGLCRRGRPGPCGGRLGPRRADRARAGRTTGPTPTGLAGPMPRADRACRRAEQAHADRHDRAHSRRGRPGPCRRADWATRSTKPLWRTSGSAGTGRAGHAPTCGWPETHADGPIGSTWSRWS